MLPGYKYLQNERKLTEETIKTFHLGYCDAKGVQYFDADFPVNKLTLDNRYNMSVLFPIFDVYKNLIAVSARRLLKDGGPKYVNTVYQKTHHLFGLDVTWQECLKAQKAYVVEGNVDAITMYQHGIKNVVGMLGSNFTGSQLCLLYRLVKEIVFVPDGDKAGVKFYEKLREIVPQKFYDLDMQFSVITLPDGYDPDKFLNEKGKDELIKLEKKLFQSLDDKLKEI